MEVTVRLILEVQSPQILQLLKNFTEDFMTVTQAQLNEIKQQLGSKADLLLEAIAEERGQVSTAIGEMRSAIDGLKAKIAELEAREQLVLDLSDEFAKLDSAYNSLPDIYVPEPVTPPDTPPVVAPDPVSA